MKDDKKTLRKQLEKNFKLQRHIALHPNDTDNARNLLRIQPRSKSLSGTVRSKQCRSFCGISPILQSTVAMIEKGLVLCKQAIWYTYVSTEAVNYRAEEAK